MSELQTIVDAFVETHGRRERAALATVVSVAGSAYRRPGARMIVTETGTTVGSISGGCLEADVVERAKSVIALGVPTVVEYDTRGREDIVWGLGLGCNGVVRILIEGLAASGHAAKALQFARDCLSSRTKGVIATVVNADSKSNDKHTEQAHALEPAPHELGLRFLFTEKELRGSINAPANGLNHDIREDAALALAGGRSHTRGYEADGIEIFFDVIQPPRSLVIFGAEHDALPVMALAKAIGWHVTVVDVKARAVSGERFYQADQIILSRAEHIAAHFSLQSNMAAVVMTHNYLADIELLKLLLRSPIDYLGVLGPKLRTETLISELESQGVVINQSQLARLHAPIGIDIGAETPEEIALSIVAEIKAVEAARPAGFLSKRDAPIHTDEFVLPGSIEISRPLQSSPAAPMKAVCSS
jgi:xanthine dehydrogenase accessory factor